MLLCFCKIPMMDVYTFIYPDLDLICRIIVYIFSIKMRQLENSTRLKARMLVQRQEDLRGGACL
jgi:hypothetical protein